MAATLAFEVTRLLDGPIVPPPTAAADPHQNINGPSLLRLPDWADRSRGRYALYFAEHKGDRIKLAHADRVTGPWAIHEAGALRLDQTPFLQEAPAIPEGLDPAKLSQPRAPGVPSSLDDCVIPHIASPDAVVDEGSRTIRLYYHGLDAFARQVTRVAVSKDGVNFEAHDEVLAPPYVRVFRHDGWWYGIAMPGHVLRSRAGLTGFVTGPTLFGPDMRHAGVWRRGEQLLVFWTRVGDAPERILLSSIDLAIPWMDWRESDAVEVLRPERDWEGADQPVAPSVRSSVDRRVNQLRDPYVFIEGDSAHLVYAVAGESGLALAQIQATEPDSGGRAGAEPFTREASPAT